MASPAGSPGGAPPQPQHSTEGGLFEIHQDSPATQQQAAFVMAPQGQQQQSPPQQQYVAVSPGGPAGFAAVPQMAPSTGYVAAAAPGMSSVSSVPGGNASGSRGGALPGQPRRQSDKSLFVSGLHPNCDWTDLHERFSQYGKVISCRVLRDAKTGQSRCIGYVNFANSSDASNAVTNENGRNGPCDGGPLTIRYAEEDPNFVPEETKKLFIRYIPLNCTVERMRAAFSEYGTVTECTMMPDTSSASKHDTEPWNMGYVSFATAAEATAACAKTNKATILGPKPLIVKPAETLAARTQRQRKHDGSGSSMLGVSGSAYGASASYGAAMSGSAAGSHQTGFVAQGMPTMMAMPQQQQPQVQQQQQPFAVPPGYQLAYVQMNGALQPVLIPAQGQQQQQQQQQPQMMQYAAVPQQQQQQQPQQQFVQVPAQQYQQQQQPQQQQQQWFAAGGQMYQQQQ